MSQGTATTHLESLAMMSPSIEHVALAIQVWAKGRPLIKQVVAFGSRVTGVNHDQSDIDIALSLVLHDPDDCLAFWFEFNEVWRAELQQLVPWPVDLQFYDPDSMGIVSQSIRDASYVMYTRD